MPVETIEIGKTCHHQDTGLLDQTRQIGRVDP